MNTTRKKPLTTLEIALFSALDEKGEEFDIAAPEASEYLVGALDVLYSVVVDAGLREKYESWCKK